MIAWWWLIFTFLTGLILGMLVMAALASARIQELEAEALEHLASETPPSDTGAVNPE